MSTILTGGLGAFASTAPPPSASGWVGVEPDGTPLGEPLVATQETTFTATTTLGRAYSTDAQLSAVVVDNHAGNRVSVPHVEWIDAATGQLRLTIKPTQLPQPAIDQPSDPGYHLAYHYCIEVRTIVNGVPRLVRDTPLHVNAAFVVPPETP